MENHAPKRTDSSPDEATKKDAKVVDGSTPGQPRIVVSALIALPFDDGVARVLCSQRGMESDYRFHWELPGGKVESGESHHDALRRELREELGITICPLSEDPVFNDIFGPELCGKWTRIFFYPSTPAEEYTGYHALNYAACPSRRTSIPQPPKLGENVLGVGWFSRRDLMSNALDFVPSMRRGLEEVIRWLWAVEKHNDLVAAVRAMINKPLTR